MFAFFLLQFHFLQTIPKSINRRSFAVDCRLVRAVTIVVVATTFSTGTTRLLRFLLAASSPAQWDSDYKAVGAMK